MSRVASEATDRPSLSHASETSDRSNREQDVDEPQDPLAMTEPLSHASEASDRPYREQDVDKPQDTVGNAGAVPKTGIQP